MRATTTAHASFVDRAMTTQVPPASPSGLGLQILTKYGPLWTIAMGLVVFVCWQLVVQQRTLAQMHEEHSMLARIMYAQCINDASGDSAKTRTCLDAFQGR